ncbi:calcium/manganese antiporter SLC30A10-like [Candoia aspera]|uniref:calcium/manganese antiporter SLC30A10-like n=1 Tax=Candoia aspera TaxID=51853 RepID=UPI002FD80E3A
MGRYTGRSSRLLFMSIVTFLLFVVEMSVAYLGNSLALASDAFAVLSHLISMIIGLLGVRFSRIRWHKTNTYGFLRADVVGAFGNSVFATALMFSILIEAVKRYLHPQKTEQALYVLIVGIVGLLFNVLSYVVFMDCCYCQGSIDQDVETGYFSNDSPVMTPFPAVVFPSRKWWIHLKELLSFLRTDAYQRLLNEKSCRDQ